MVRPGTTWRAATGTPALVATVGAAVVASWEAVPLATWGSWSQATTACMAVVASTDLVASGMASRLPDLSGWPAWRVRAAGEVHHRLVAGYGVSMIAAMVAGLAATLARLEGTAGVGWWASHVWSAVVGAATAYGVTRTAQVLAVHALAARIERGGTSTAGGGPSTGGGPA